MSFNVVSGGVVRHISYCTMPGQVSTNKRDWQCVSLSGGSSISSFAVLDKFEDTLAGTYADLMTASASYYGGQLYYQTPVGPRPRPESSTEYATIGANVFDPLPTQTCGLVSLYSGTLGKTGQGRIYTPFPAVNMNDANGTPTPLTITSLQALGTKLITPITVVDGGVTGVFNPVLYIPGGAPPLQLIRFLARDAWATQRRRGSFGRLNANPF